MNGCIAEAHANSLNIPWTLEGNNFDENGLNEEKLWDNLNAACDVYLDTIQIPDTIWTKCSMYEDPTNEQMTL